MDIILETQRLQLREFSTNDARFIIDLVNTPGWIKYIGERHIKDEEKAIKYIENGPLKSYALNGFGLYLVELKDDQRPIGMCGLLRRDYLEHPDIGFAFLTEFTGKGYAFEIAQATMEYAREQLKLETIFAITLPSNTSSINLLKKLGMKLQKSFVTPEGEELLLFNLKI